MSAIYSHANERPCSKNFLSTFLALFVEYKSRLQELELLLNRKPEWACYTPRRSWRRHSALLTQLHEMNQEH